MTMHIMISALICTLLTSTAYANPSPWYFHSGEGFIQIELTSANGKTQTQRVPCELSEQDPDCKELIYQLSKAEIQQFVLLAKQIYQARISNHEANIGIGVLVASWAGSAAYKAVVVDPSKITAILGSVVSVAAAGYAAWEGLKMRELLQTVADIDDLLADEERYVNRCNHVRNDFYQSLSDLGVQLIFNRNSAKLIDSEFYFDALKREQRAEATKKKRIAGGMSQQKAERLYSDSCDQMPVLLLNSPGSPTGPVDYIGMP